ncbi:MAG: hypothetical protein SNJ62_08590 [Chloracidobacterium sp.]
MAEMPIYNDSYRPSSNWAKQLETAQRAHPAEVIQVAGERLLPMWVEALLAYEPPPPPVVAVEDVARWLLARATAVAKEERDALTRADLTHAYQTLVGGAAEAPVWRVEAGCPQVESHQPAAPTAVPLLLDMTLDWFTTDAFAELHPVEQAGLFHLRLLDLQPFAAHSNLLVRLLSSFYVLRAGLPPLIPVAQEQAAYQAAIGYAFQMITQPSLELFARWLLATYAQIEAKQEEHP